MYPVLLFHAVPSLDFAVGAWVRRDRFGSKICATLLADLARIWRNNIRRTEIGDGGTGETGS